MAVTAMDAGVLGPFLAKRLIGPDLPRAEELMREYLALACDEDDAGWPTTQATTVDVLSEVPSRVLSRFTKLLFNHYFQYDLYGPDRERNFLVLSSGSMHEPTFGLTPSLKRCLGIALRRDWYGYSDSRGRVNARQAVARLENQRLGVTAYDEDCVAVTMGGTFAVSCLVDYLATTLPPGSAVCAVPNYPPLVESVAQRMPLRLVNTPTDREHTSVARICDALSDDTRLVLLQSVTNPTGLPVSETELEQVIAATGPQTYLILDEAHECFGAPRPLSPLRAHPRVIRVTSLSKQLSIPGMKVGWMLGTRDFVDGFYEYASTTYGGPASFFYSLVDVYATFERLALSGVDDIRDDELRGIEQRYDMAAATAQRWYARYRTERNTRIGRFLAQRSYAVEALRAAGYRVVTPRYSVNCTVEVDSASSYRFFRRALDVGVSVYPNVLAFDLSDRGVRLTVGRDFAELRQALSRLGQVCLRRTGRSDDR